MFTNEIEYDCTVTTVLDEEGRLEDVEMIMDDEHVFIRQYYPDNKESDIVILTHKMFYDMIEALDHPEGLYFTEFNDKRRK